MASSTPTKSLTTDVEAVPKEGRTDSPHTDINILLLGPTGVGKTTFINALVNYLVYDSLDQGINAEMQSVIPSSFIYYDGELEKEWKITIGKETDYEKFTYGVESATQLCRSFVFPIGNRRLRIIDTPGIGDTKGLEKDAKNLQEIFKFISQYEYLNAVCILLKPNEERLSIHFRFCVNELFRHLHRDVTENLMFVFTNASVNHYRVGNTKTLLNSLFQEHRSKYKVDIPFTKENSFLFDNEGFRYLAMRKNGIELDAAMKETAQKSWKKATEECSRFFSHVVQCPRHYVHRTVSLNEAQQLIRKLPRPIAETQRLIAENIQLAEKYERNVLDNPQLAKQGIPQNKGRVIKLPHPQTVCASEKCRQVIDVNGEKRVEYKFICHEECYLKAVQQETLATDELQLCTAIDYKTDLCFICGCNWQSHIHISYVYRIDRTHLTQCPSTNAVTEQTTLSIGNIKRRIRNLREEATQIQEIYKKVAEFLYANAMVPFNDAYIGYLDYCIEVERGEQRSDENDTSVLSRLRVIREDFQNHIDTFKASLQTEPGQDNSSKTEYQLADIFNFVEELYALPINGVQLREQIIGIQDIERKTIERKEHHVQLPAQAASSQVMKALTDLVVKTSIE